MRRVVIFLLLGLLGVTNCGLAQDVSSPDEKPIIESVDVSGVPDSRITSELREAMQALVGQRFDQLSADELGFRIQSQVSQRISAIRQLPGSTPDRVKLLFEFGNLPPQPEREDKHGIHIDWDTNVNSRYTVEAVELRGLQESILSDSLREDMHKLVGEKLDEDRVDNIERHLKGELKPNYAVSRKVERGSDKEHIRLVFEIEATPLFNFHKYGSYLVGQSKQGVSYGLGIDFDHRRNRLAFGLLDDGDALIERDEGYRLAFENIHAGTEHAGFRLEYFDYNLKWKSATQTALSRSSGIPGIYRERRGIAPRVTVAVNRSLRFDLGVDVSELQMQYPVIHSQNANAWSGTATYDREWLKRAGINQRGTANYTIRTASHNLNSDFIYTRHLVDAQYILSQGRNQFVATGMAGLVTGQAPLFERFVLGNASTLRGWNKYDLAPLGGNRLAYGSLEYRYSVLQVFYDVGSVWEHPNPYQVSHAVGFGFHSRDRDKQDDNWFMTFGVPIRSGHIQPLKPLFMIGGRF